MRSCSRQSAVSPRRVRCVLQLPQRPHPPSAVADVVMVQADGPTADQRRKVFAVQSRSHAITIATAGGGPPAAGLMLPSIDGCGYYNIMYFGGSTQS